MNQEDAPEIFIEERGRDMESFDRSGLPEGYTHCDQCLKGCPVEKLSCSNGRRRYEELTGKPYPVKETAERSGYREMIRRRRGQKK